MSRCIQSAFPLVTTSIVPDYGLIVILMCDDMDELEAFSTIWGYGSVGF
ncbi:hypothetical protein [Neobacillus bataviensis]|nr:hypothetical protein [Neobacillus bataviensis]